MGMGEMIVQQIQDAVKLSHETGFFTSGSFILGAPNESKQHLNNTIYFARSLPLHSVSFLPLRYMVGSELWNDAVKNKKIMDDEYVVIADSKKQLSQLTKEEIISFCKKGERLFYIRPKFLVNLIHFSLQQHDYSFLKAYLTFFLPMSPYKKKPYPLLDKKELNDKNELLL